MHTNACMHLNARNACISPYIYICNLFVIIFSEENTPDGAPLKIIDFGRSIDMRLFPTGTTFSTDCHTDGFQCVEMKEGRPWTKQVGSPITSSGDVPLKQGRFLRAGQLI